MGEGGELPIGVWRGCRKDNGMISAEEYTQRWVRKSMMTFLEGTQDIAWIVGVIRTSGVEGQAYKRSLIG